VRTIYDDDLLEQGDLYFEAGDHERLVHVTREQFQRLMANQLHGSISHRSRAQA
jgi:Ala-tRNA(Pro) deacylase